MLTPGSAQQEITEYFAGQRQSFQVALDTPGSEFQRAVWRRLQHVSFGETTHYQSIAMEIGKSDAHARGCCCKRRQPRRATINPSHRIYRRKDGWMTGYGGGIALTTAHITNVWKPSAKNVAHFTFRINGPLPHFHRGSVSLFFIQHPAG
ncbi:MGMT family protein [Klebsiella pneumoniae]|nr:MGMT family protein [Klebsiella pneumoniae]